MATAALDLIVNLQDRASGALERMSGTVSKLGSIATGVAAGGLLAIGGAAVGAATAGLRFNATMENVTAQLNAFTKDGNKSAAILDMIRERAAKTPFAFEAMAQATAGLLPAANQSGQSLESLIEKAEILAASNPAEGLEGAAFALREAVSGDFASAIERFNLPRQYINQLKEEGVPNLEIVSRAMQQMGYDTSLVTNLAETASGRWSTFKDTLTGIAASATASVFDQMSGGLGRVNEALAANAPQLEAFAQVVGEKLGQALSWLIETGVPALVSSWASVTQAFQQVQPYLQPLIDLIGNNLQPILLSIAAVLAGTVVVAVGSAIASFVAAATPIAALIAAGAALYAAWQSNFGGIRDIVGAVWAFIVAQTQPVFQTLSRFWTEIQPNLQAAWANIQQTVTTVLAGIVGFIHTNMGSIQLIFQGVWQVIQGVVQTAWALISGIIKTGLALLAGDWRGAWEAIKQTVQGVWDGLKTIISGAMTYIQGLVRTGMAALADIVRGVGPALQSAGSAIVGMLKSGISSAWEGLKSFFRGKLDDLRNMLPFSEPKDPSSPLRGLVETGKTIIAMIQQGIASGELAIDEKQIKVVDQILGIVDKAAGALGAVAKLDLGDGKTLGGPLLQVVVGNLTRIVIQLQEAFEDFDLKAMQATATMTEAVGKVIGVVGSAVDALTKLGSSEITEIPGPAIQRFVGMLVRVVIQLQEAFEDFDLKAMQATATMTEAVGKVIGVVGGAVQALTALGTNEIMEIPGPAMQRFVGMLVRLVVQMQEAFASFAADAFEQTAGFMESVGKILQPIKLAVDSFRALQDLEHVPPQRMEMLAANIYLAVWWMTEIAKGAETKGLEAAKAFSEAVLKVFGAIKAAIDTIRELIKIEDVPPDRFETFKTAFYRAVNMMQEITANAGGMLSNARSWRDRMIDLRDAIIAGIDAIKAIPEIPGIPAPGGAAPSGGGINMPTPSQRIPRFAAGVSNFGGGYALVGEQGPELVHLPRGTDVYSTPETRGMLGGDTYIFNIDARGATPGMDQRIRAEVERALNVHAARADQTRRTR